MSSLSAGHARAYDRAADPAGRRPLPLEVAPARYDTLRAILLHHIRECGAHPAAGVVEMDERTAEQLRSLGY
jgi:hypothetical protein